MAAFNFCQFSAAIVLLIVILAPQTLIAAHIGVETLHPHSRRAAYIDLFENVGAGSCLDVNFAMYNSILIGSTVTNAEACAALCSTINPLFQVGFEHDVDDDECHCLYSAGNVPAATGSGMMAGTVGEDGKYAIMRALPNVNPSRNCYKVKTINPLFANSLFDYASRSIFAGYSTSSDSSNPCDINPNFDGFTCHFSYDHLDGTMLYVKVFDQCGGEGMNAPAGMIHGDGGVLFSTDNTTIEVWHDFAFTAEQKNSGIAQERTYCVRADMYDLMAQQSVVAKKMEVSTSVSFDQSGTFQTQNINVAETESLQNDLTATRNMLLLASQGTCDEDETHPNAVSPGESVDVCIYLFGAEGDASIADIQSLEIFQDGVELWAPIQDGTASFLTAFRESGERPTDSVLLSFLIPTQVFDNLQGSGAVVLMGRATVSYTEMRRELHSLMESRSIVDAYESKSFSLEIMLKDHSLPDVAMQENSSFTGSLKYTLFSIFVVGAMLIL